ncbi:3-hydroxyacyl-CoA dehydrogenase family protein [Fulvivirga lutimaris]|uniref:3-hydroxyacyl-CoA dehydrogenase family protein n=1 Tax=Fulvivirga lutimaris TaxID=1819566 RepID=UPI0012BB705F|nr:3-hydroxyacyl-CoA dehydrogenase family protein [Fulvivirga lutimaris]MTI38812.1 3-hydroxyacyl-CoA dehydrogenase [Fulvivirga lutimaris]
MKILIVGSERSFAEAQNKLENQHSLTHVYDFFDCTDPLTFDFIFDFMIDENPELVEHYAKLEKVAVFLNTVRISLGELQFTYGSWDNSIYGFNGLPTFFDREVLELTSINGHVNENLLTQLDFQYEVVDDRVGMVTPRVVLMIINEAFYTVMEGTASKEDIDQGMKLGTNYPFGPFEWCERIGISQVYETLEALYEDTKEERYKIAPLLKQEYLKS